MIPIEMISQLKVMESYAFVAPVLFIMMHILRPLLFIPVLLLCITGGLLFGLWAGTVYSIIGLVISSVIFYMIIHFLPALEARCKKLEKRLLGDQLSLNTVQIMLLRMLPFIHFHLMSFCIYQKSVSFTSYLRTTLFTVIPVAIFYTTLGRTIQEISVYYAIPLVSTILILAYFVRKKQVIIKWHTFFQEKPVS
ncbi:VTT domain-containing protein [Gracilibacillus caseinilyticus]|uniref:TVP38/TMEM64 family membrane protein n=1 Tax=Gracilibacillus caseinilyticus TaxID=2932256 RepID=A0ABY4EYD9_9BACI|nr:VTT domain-containing protein [Gracilibacillus caseinilyticus]UOQ47186.1 VTT domain-containing protein [Gracilibacillus caseinilyticus]